MARTSKTVIGGDAAARTKALRDASATGQASKQRASETLSAEYRASGQLKAQGGQAVGQSISHYKDRELQQDIATGQEISRDRDRELQAAAQGLEVTPGGMESPLIARHREGLEGQVAQGEAAQRQLGDQKAPGDQTAADKAGQPAQAKGPSPAGGAAPAQGGGAAAAAGAMPAGAMPPAVSGLQNPQQAQQQAQTPVEQRRPGSYGPTQRRMQQEAAGARAAQSEFAQRIREVDAKSLDAATNFLNAETKAGEAGAKARENAIKVMTNGMATTRSTMSELAGGKIEASSLTGLFPGNSDMDAALESGDDAQIMSTTMRLLDNKLAMQNIQYMAVTGMGAPDMSGSNEIFQTFMMREAEMKAAFRGGKTLGPLGSGDASAMKPFTESVRAAGGALDEDPNQPGNQMGAMRQAWAGFSGPYAFDEQQKFLRRATARAMIETEELTRRGRMDLQVSGAAQESMAKDQRIAELEQQVAQQNEELGYGPEGPPEAGSGVTELEGGQRVSTTHAAETQRRIEGQAAGKPVPGTIGEDMEARRRKREKARRHGGTL